MSRIADAIKQKEDRGQLSGLIRRGLEAKQIPKKRAAEAAGIKPSHFSQVLAGKKSLGREKLIALARVLDIPYTDILLAGGYTIDDLGSVELQTLFSPNVFREPIRIVTDPRFPDSALFAWIFSLQPFRLLGAECELVSVDWRSVPETVANSKYTIGFYNRRANTLIGNKKVPYIRSWIDLCLYRGYALCVRQGEVITAPKTITETNAYLATVVEACRKERRKPVIVSMGADTVWRLRNPLNPLLRSGQFSVRTFGNSDYALQTFLGGAGDLFVGGLSQLNAAKRSGCVEVLNNEINPLLFSLNSLVCSPTMMDERRTLLIAASALWFETIVKLRNNPSFRTKTIPEILLLLETLRIQGHSLDAELLHQCYADVSGSYEFFPQSPTDLLDELLRVTQRVIDSVPPEQFFEAFQALQETLQKNLQD